MNFDGPAFGRRVAAARVWRGLKPKQVSQHLGLSTEAINRWERGDVARPPSRGQLKLLADLLEQPETWLLDGSTPPWEGGTIEVSDDRLVAAFDELRDELRDRDERLERSIGQLRDQVTRASERERL